jgi:hypothetical protein
LSPTSRQTSTSPVSRSAFSRLKISLPLAWPHQLPFTGAPTIASTRFGTGPRADSSTTPFARTKRNSSALFTLSRP